MMEDEKTKKAYEDGWNDSLRGRPASANPHRASIDNEKNLAWLRGWFDAPQADAMLAARGGK